MDEDEVAGNIPHPNPSPITAKNLTTKEDVANKIKEWMTEENNYSKSYENAISYIESQLERPLSYLETTWFERQYVITLLELWLEKSLGKAFEYLENSKNDISKDMSTVLSQLDSINSFEDIRSQLNDTESPLRDWCNKKCPYLQLILEQENLFKNTPSFTVFVNCYFKQFKTSCTDRVFSRCFNDIIKNETHGEKHEKFMIDLKDFLVFINEDKNLLEKLLKENVYTNYVKDDSKTGQDLVEKLVDIFVTSSKNDFLNNVEKQENLQSILEKDLKENNINIENITATDWQGLFQRLGDTMSQSFLQTSDGSQTAIKIPEWFTHFQKTLSLLNDVGWTPPLQLLTKETCKIFLLPETEIEFKEEDGKEIISIKGVAIFVSKMMEEINRLKVNHPDVKEIKIIGLQSVHIDCDLDNDTWHGINIGILTDKLIVDDVINENESVKTFRCWNVSGKNTIAQPCWGEPKYFDILFHSIESDVEGEGYPGESGGNVRVVCNQIINGQKWTIVSDGGDGSSAYKWTREEFEKSFPSMSAGDSEKNRNTVLTTLEKMLPKESRFKGEDILPGHMGNFLIQSLTKGRNEITAIFYEGKEKQTLIRIKGAMVGKGGYGGDIAVECLDNTEVNQTPGMPLTGTRRKNLTAVRLGVYEASGPNGNIGKGSGDVAFIHKANESGEFHGFDEDKKIGLQLNVKKVQKEDKNYVKYEYQPNTTRYAKLILSSNLDDRRVAAYKKNAVIRQSLIRYLDEINERNQWTKSIHKMLEHHTNNIDEILNEMENKVHKFHQLITQRLQHQKIDQEQYVKPSFDSSNSFPNHEIIGRRLGVRLNEICPDELEILGYLDILLTGDGTDSLLHCLFGQLNSEGKYVCKDTDKFRQMIADKLNQQLLQPETDISICKFVLYVEDEKRFPNASAKRIEYIKFIQSIIGQFPQLKKNEIDFLLLDHEEALEKVEDETERIKIETKLLKYREKWGKDQVLKEEYAQNIESLGHRVTLGIFELGVLADLFQLEIYVYEQHSSSHFQYKQKIKLYHTNQICGVYWVLYEGNGRWKRLQYNYNLKSMCCQLSRELDVQNSDSSGFETLKDWIVKNEEITKKDDVISIIEKFNPKDKTPDKLSQLLFDQLKKMDINQLKKTISPLAEWVDYYNKRNISPVFYLHVVKTCKPQEWEREFLLLETKGKFRKKEEDGEYEEDAIRIWAKESAKKILQKLRTEEEERENWRKEMFDSKICLTDQEMLSKLTRKKKENELFLSLDLKKQLRMLQVLKEIDVELTILNEKDIDQLSLIHFFYKERGTFWEKIVGEWLKQNQQLKKENKKVYVNLLLKLEYKNKQELLCNITESAIESSEEAIEYLKCKTHPEQNTTAEQKKLEEIIGEIKRKNKKKTKFLSKIENMVTKSNSKKKTLEEFVECYVKKLIEKNRKEYDEYTIFLKGEESNPKKNSKKTISERFLNVLKEAGKKSDDEPNRIRKLIIKGFDRQFNNADIEDFLCVFDFAVERTMGFSLRDTQRVAIMTLLMDKQSRNEVKNTLAQVSTGEGKSIIVAGVAIGLALDKNKVDVITSNDVLAVRDSRGLKELYEFFDITVANNCSPSEDDRRSAYNMNVVYGQLANFQRDYLLDKFYNRNIRGDRRMRYVIVDEVDCMLLDRGNNVLYLSHDIPGMEMLESLYVFIWEQIRDNPPETKEKIKSAILLDLYGQITQQDLKKIHAPLELEEFASERTAIWEYLIKQKVIDVRGRLLINELKEGNFNYKPSKEELKEKQLNSKIIFYLRTVVERQRRIRIPSHLLDFVDRHLDTWLDNARRALQLKQDEDYVIDHNRSDTSPDLNPQVIIIDPFTGTDQSGSQWDGALHQFLQLKEGCKLTLQSLKAVFISNATYIKKYHEIKGVSGTLGSEPEQQFLQNKYCCYLFTVPTSSPKRFSLKPPKLLKTRENWLNAITKETRQTIQENRSIVIFCRSIKEVNKVYQLLKSAIPDLKDNTNERRIHRYTRDSEKFEFEKEKLGVGQVIVTTNLAGRGTDIKISKKLKDSGGLHVCLTYFPENERVEKQAMGRAARKGEPGSGILILCETPTDHQESGTSEEWEVEKMFVMKEERAWQERQRIPRLENDFHHIERIEKLFKSFTKNFSEDKVKNTIEEKKKNKQNEDDIILLDNGVLRKFIQGSALDRWALWLDERDYNFKCFNLKTDELPIHLKDFDLTSELLTSLTPARQLAIAKYLATLKIEENKKIVYVKEKATEILNELIESKTDKFFCPAAFYYHAFNLIRETKWNNKIINEEDDKNRKFILETLRNTETLLNDHIDMQIYFSQIHQSKKNPGQINSFFAVDGYNEQKENNIKIFHYFLASIQWMLGRHCSLSDLREAGKTIPKNSGFIGKLIKKTENFIENKKTKKDEELKKHKIRLEKVDEYFRELVTSKCIVCELNDPNTIPSDINKSTNSGKETRSQIILQIADDYGVDSSLEDKLTLVFKKALNEEEIEKKLKKEIKIKYTRKAFWEKLIRKKALNPLKEWKFTECVIMSEKQLEELQPKLDRSKAIMLDFGVKSFDNINNCLYVLYNPTYDSQQQLRAAKKVMFSKEYVHRQLMHDKFNELKKNFESNKIAQLDLTKLKDVNLESLLDRLCWDDLGRINIDRSEHQGIWDQLKSQKIINDLGYFDPSYDLTKDFSYPDCPGYADAVTRLIRKKFVVEMVRQQWLKSKDNRNYLKAINLLPRKPYRDMLADLMAAHIISGARVTENFAINFKSEIDKITEDDQERKSLVEFLTSRQSVFTEKLITPEFFLDFIERDMRWNSLSSELYVFRLVGFDQVIDIRDREWTFQRILSASIFAPLIVVGGLTSIGGGAALTYLNILSLGFCKNLFFMGGFSDILYVVDTILSRKNFTWADYGRQRIRSAIGKMEPIDAIKAIGTLTSSYNERFEDETITNEHRWKKQADQNQ